MLQDQPNTFSVIVSGPEDGNAGVNVSFFGGITFGRVGIPSVTEDGVLQVASMDDLMATKLKVILQRIEAKDYIDIAAMIEAGASLERGLAGARTLYGMAFQPSECLKALVYFEGGDLDRMPQTVRDVLIDAVREVRALPDVDLVSRQLALPAP